MLYSLLANLKQQNLHTLHICHQRMRQHLGNSWFISSSLMCRKLWISSFTVRNICLWYMCTKQEKEKEKENWNACWWYLGVFSPLILQSPVMRGKNHGSLKWGNRGTEKSKGWLRISHWPGYACGWFLLYCVQLPSRLYDVYLKCYMETLFILL